jgi:formate dehydrogenase alpha subunit
MPSIQVHINGKDVSVRESTTILAACESAGVHIPVLCNHPRLKIAGNCRLCCVEVEGYRTMQPACVTPVTPGMIIRTDSPAVMQARRTIVNLLLASHNCDCLVCEAAGACELQKAAYELGLDVRSRQFFQTDYDLPEVDASSPVLQYDPSKCIRCTRCIRACSEIQGKGIPAAVHRSADVRVTAGIRSWSDSRCDGCGECIQICPTGALSQKVSPGVRIWDARKIRTSCAYCGVGCQLDMWVHEGRIVKVEGADIVPNFGSTCVKGRFGNDFVDSPDRLKTPMVRRDGVLTEASWEEAIGEIASRLGRIRDEHGPDAIAGLASARVTNEENYLFQKMIRAGFGTNNVDHCARLCHASTVAGLAAAFGSGAMTNSIAELEHAKCILVTGSNTSETHPVIATVIRRAVREHGAKLIIVDPRRIDLVDNATLWLRQRNGTDVAWMNGMMNVILTENLMDLAFIEQRTEGFEEFRRVIERFTPERVEEISGIPADKLRQAARLYATSEASSIIYSMGITQHITGTDNVLSTANLAMLTGQIGKPSSGVNPLRGQNNVQGACDVGALPNVYPGYQKVTELALQEKFEKAWGRKLSPVNGLTILEMMKALEHGTVKGMIVMGENPMVSDPNLTHVEKALRSAEFLVVMDIFLSETAAIADVVLPAASFAEKEGTFTNTERRVILLREILPPPGQSRPDWKIICDLSTALGYPMSYSSASEIMDEIASVTPIYGGIHHNRLQETGLQWPCPNDAHSGTVFLHRDKFSRGLGKFHPVNFIPPDEMPDAEYPFILSTGRILFHYHTGTMSRRVDALNEYVGAGYAEIHPNDAVRIGLQHGGQVRVSSRRGAIETVVKVTERVAEGSVFIPFHFAEAAANMLTNDALDPVAKIPEFKVAACNLTKVLEG